MQPIRQREDAELRLVRARELALRIGRPPPPPKPRLPPFGEMEPGAPEEDTVVSDLVRALYGKPIRAREIVAIVCQRSGFTANAILSHNRAGHLVRLRQEIAWLIQALTPMSLNEAAKLLHRDHSTLIHGIARVMTRHDLPEPGKAPRQLAMRILERGAGK